MLRGFLLLVCREELPAFSDLAVHFRAAESEEFGIGAFAA